ncbi:DUF2397 domain-containing protein [Kitasatospora purpeofusca]|uniref:hypothetical protein n=1 Tax=Kitasatospora purpeofusca TaxID=67352 RepID=UPI002E117568|nr:DUF2397 domain-containing protein [Kitasatospora purpeofusca]
MVEVPTFGGQMKIAAYLTHENALYYRVILDVLLEEEARLGIHLSTAEIAHRVRRALAVLTTEVGDGVHGAVILK